ncbi:MAG: S-layer homology domain-containing protein, partial [Acidimicrobiia bacterium]|nr:S-layer homology domain-containing protein [Acidimicrobiia bacterium]MDX2467541.1 S-layer homology domain-containing protein [Acidimicrobiia bacterium]
MKHLLFVVALIAGLLALIGVASADLPPGGSFNDDNGNIHEANIEAIAAAGITKGCNPPINDKYCPDKSVTRGQMAAFLVRALNLTDDGGGNTFVDDDGSMFEADIAKLAAAGITKGCNPPVNDMFCPDKSVTRGQMAAFLVRALNLSDDGGGNTFLDDNGSTFEVDIAKLAAAGITKGCNPPANDRYCPGSAVQRDQMASFLARALNLDPITPPPPAGVQFTGPLESRPDLSGEISFEVSDDNTEVKNVSLAMDFHNYDCGGGWTKSTTGGKMTIFATLPVTNGSFSYTSSTFTLSGSFDSP